MCDYVECSRRTEIYVGWLPASARTGENVDIEGILFDLPEEELQRRRNSAEGRDRAWFGGCTDHAREVWKRQAANGASPVYRRRGA